MFPIRYSDVVLVGNGRKERTSLQGVYIDEGEIKRAAKKVPTNQFVLARKVKEVSERTAKRGGGWWASKLSNEVHRRRENSYTSMWHPLFIERFA